MKFHKHIALYLFSLIMSLSAVAQKTDTIYHINGNVLTGDFKRLNYGVVSWNMDGMGTISLETPSVNTIKSAKQFEIKLKNGLIYFGSFDTSANDKMVNIVLSNGMELVSISEIVEVYPIKRNFWLRTSGNFSLGLNYSKGSDVATITVSGDINYRKRKSYIYFSFDDYNTYQADTLKSTKADAVLGWQRNLRKKWSAGLITGVSQNSELGTKLRFNITLAAIRDLVYNNWNRFYTMAGFSLQREISYDDAVVSSDLAGLVSVVWKVYKYTNPKVWVDAELSFVPYLTNIERYRTSLNLNPRISVIGDDLKLGLNTYYTYDTKPPTLSAATTDWGVNLEITYSFH